MNHHHQYRPPTTHSDIQEDAFIIGNAPGVPPPPPPVHPSQPGPSSYHADPNMLPYPPSTHPIQHHHQPVYHHDPYTQHPPRNISDTPSDYISGDEISDREDDDDIDIDDDEDGEEYYDEDDEDEDNASRSLYDEEQEQVDDEEENGLTEENGDAGGGEEGRLVRQDSSFARLSAESWLTVVSEYEKDGPNENLLFSQVEEEPEHDPIEAAAASEMTAASALAGKSVLDCVVDLLKGTRAQKRKMLRRYGERWIWLGEDLLSLNWKSKRRGVDNGRLNLTKVKKLRSQERELIVETNEGRKLALILATKEESTTWLTGLSCLVPKKAKVLESNKVLQERVNYDPLRDSWRGKAVSTRKHVNEYIILGGIGKGSFGKVKLALSTVDKRFYAVKVISNVKKNGLATQMNNAEEQAVLRKLDHPNIVRHRDILMDHEKDGYCVVVEYMARGVVIDSSKLEGVKPLSEDGVREIMRDVVAGLEYLHYQRIAHRDIKPDNLLRSGDGTVKVSDFGEARMYDVTSEDPRSKTAAPGTPAFIAPELCMSERSPKAPPESYAADIWSLGASLFYMVYGRAPFLAKTVFEIYDCICTQRLRFPEQPKVSRRLKDLIKKMLVKEPKNRATLQDVARHAWFGERVVQREELKKIRITPADVESAIGVARWTYPPGHKAHKG